MKDGQRNGQGKLITSEFTFTGTFENDEYVENSGQVTPITKYQSFKYTQNVYFKGETILNKPCGMGVLEFGEKYKLELNFIDGSINPKS